MPRDDARPGTDQSEPPGAAGVPSAWGNTQRGRHRSWQRHGIPLVLLLGVVGLGAYWVSHLVSPPPLAGVAPPAQAHVTPTESRLANTPAAQGAEAQRKEAPPAEPALAAQPVAATLSTPQAAGGSEQETPRVHVVPPAAGAALPAKPNAVPAPSAASAAPATPAAKPAPGVAPGSANPAQATLPQASPARATPPRATPPRAMPPGFSVPDQGDKPKSEPSPRAGVVDVPDFGGRE